MNRLSRVLLVLLPLPALLGAPASAAEAPRCAAVSKPNVPGAKVVSVTTVEKPGGGTVSYPTYPGYPTRPPITNVPAHCDVSVILTHPGVDDRVLVRVWSPTADWTGRFQGVGGGGFAMGEHDPGLAVAIKLGYSAASTDGGHDSNGMDPGSWALGDDGHVDQELLTNFASRSLHDMAVVGKAVTAQFYDRPANYSYWNGCSTGGRQGLMQAQRYPDDYDGINANAPAINWPRFLVANMWPQVVMTQERNIPTQCEFSAFRTAAVSACDGSDGVTDGVIGQPEWCRFNPYSLVGTKVLCDGKEVTISLADADVVRKIWDGPRGWYGLNKGTPFGGLANTVTGPDGTTIGKPFPIAENWVKYFLREDPEFDTSTITYRDFDRLMAQSYVQYNRTIGTDDPNLSKFRATGGKMITWHGVDDAFIPVQGTINYRDRVERTMGGASQVDKFYRVFLAPGVGHCMGGVGPVPTDPLAAVVAWVERGHAPDTLPASGATGIRDLCRYPMKSQYNGHGDPKLAASYTCVR